MNKAIRFYIITAIIILLLILCLVLRGKKGIYGKNYTLAVFNTMGSVSLWGKDEAVLDKAFQEIMFELQALHNVINAYDAKSELHRLNDTAFRKPFVCGDALWNIILASREAFALTEGAFDPTVGAAMRLWGFHKKMESLPSQEEIIAALAKVGLGKVIFDDDAHSVRFPMEGMALDFGGIAKGYALDIAKNILDTYGIDMYMIDLGGNLLLSEKVPGGEDAFKVSIRDPDDKAAVARVLRLKGCAVATSGNNERSRIIQGRKIGHIMDPATGTPVTQFASVTAITRKGVHSDVFSTAVFVRGKPLAERLRQAVPGTDFVILE